MFDPKKFVEENQITDGEDLRDQIIKRIYLDDSYDGGLVIVFSSGKFVMFDINRGYEDDVDIQIGLRLEPPSYRLLRRSHLVSEKAYDEWQDNKQQADQFIRERQEEIEERKMLAKLKKKYEK